jgi:hypothetical protein
MGSKAKNNSNDRIEDALDSDYDLVPNTDDEDEVEDSPEHNSSSGTRRALTARMTIMTTVQPRIPATQMTIQPTIMRMERRLMMMKTAIPTQPPMTTTETTTAATQLLRPKRTRMRRMILRAALAMEDPHKTTSGMTTPTMTQQVPARAMTSRMTSTLTTILTMTPTTTKWKQLILKRAAARVTSRMAMSDQHRAEDQYQDKRDQANTQHDRPVNTRAANTDERLMRATQAPRPPTPTTRSTPATSGKRADLACGRPRGSARMQNLLARSRPLNNYQGACSSSPNVKDFWAKFQICSRVSGSL